MNLGAFLRRDWFELRTAEPATAGADLLALPNLGVATLDPRTLHWRDVNPVLCGILAVERDELLVRPWVEWLHPDEREQGRVAIADLVAGITGNFHKALRMVRNDRVVIDVELAVCCVRDANGEARELFVTIQDLTVLHAVQRKLADSERRFQALSESSPAAFVMCEAELRPNGTLVSLEICAANPAAEATIGEVAAQLLGQRLSAAQLNSAEPPMAEVVSDVLRSGKPHDFVLRLPAVDGAFRVNMFRISSRRVGVLFLDQGEAERHERYRVEQEQRYRRLFLANPHPMWVCSQDTCQFLVVNDAAIATFGYDRSEFLEMRVTDLLRPDDGELFRARAARSCDDYTNAGIWRFQTKAGETRHVEIVAHRFEHDGRPATIAHGHDVTLMVDARKQEAAHTAKIERTLTSTITALSQMVELRDPYTAGHERRVAQLSVAIAQSLQLSEIAVNGIFIAALLHDIGKITVPSEILTKPGRLSEPEHGILRAHAEVGFGLLRGIDFGEPVASIVHQHHERMDGSGYPRGLVGDEILLQARILAVADTVDAMASPRPYRQALGIEAALSEIRDNAGARYDPVVVQACLRVMASGFTFVK